MPASWRPKLIGENFSGIIAQSSLVEKTIDAFPKQYLEILQSRLDENDPLLEKNDYESTIIFGGSVLSFDNEGRVVLPDLYKNEAGINNEALFFAVAGTELIMSAVLGYWTQQIRKEKIYL